jgi:ArsR family metal-binding transcriptional regulator
MTQEEINEAKRELAEIREEIEEVRAIREEAEKSNDRDRSLVGLDRLIVHQKRKDILLAQIYQQ